MPTIDWVWGALRGGRGLGLALGALAAPMAAEAECRLILLSDMAVTMVGPAPMLDTQVNGEPVRLLVDTGASWSALDRPKADELDLRMYSPQRGLRVRGIGGVTGARLTEVDSFAFGEWDLSDVEFFVLDLPRVDGVLGQNILGLQDLDVEFDLSNARMRFHHGEDCRQSVLAYWAGERAWSVADLEDFALAPDMMTTYAEVNGERMRVLIDTGAAVTVLSERAARRAGIDLEGPDVTAGGEVRGVGSLSRRTWVARLDTFTLGDQQVSNPPVRVVDSRLRVDMILGADFLASHRILISNEQEKMYFTYEGGPIFNAEVDAFVELGGEDVEAGAEE